MVSVYTLCEIEWKVAGETGKQRGASCVGRFRIRTTRTVTPRYKERRHQMTMLFCMEERMGTVTGRNVGRTHACCMW